MEEEKEENKIEETSPLLNNNGEVNTQLIENTNTSQEQNEERPKKTRVRKYEKVSRISYDPQNMSTYEKHLALKTAEGALFSWPKESQKRKREEEEDDFSKNKVQKMEENGEIKDINVTDNLDSEKLDSNEGLIEYLEKGGYKLNHPIETKRIKPFTDIPSLKQFIVDNKISFNNVIETTFNVGITADYFLANSEDIHSFVVSFDRMLNKYSFLSKLYIDINYHIQHLLIVGDTSSSIPQYSTHFPQEFHFNLIFIDLTNPETSYKKVQNDLHNLKSLCSADVRILFDHSVPQNQEFSFTLAKYTSSHRDASNIVHTHANIIEDLVSNGEIELISTSKKERDRQPDLIDTIKVDLSSQNDNQTSMPLKDRNQEEIIPYPNPPSLDNNYQKRGKTSIDDFLLSAKYHLRNDIEGHSKDEHFEKFHLLFEENPQIRTITEIGFNAGHSCQFFLQKLLLYTKEKKLDDSSIEMVSFDIILHDYCFYSKVYIDQQFPNRHLLIAGDSNEAVQMYHSINPEKKFDLLFIDGDHTFAKALLDIKNMRHLAHKDSILIIDNIAPHRGVGIQNLFLRKRNNSIIQVYEAMEKAIEEKIFLFQKHEEVGDYADGFAIGKYHFGDEEEYEKALQVFRGEISHMKRRIAICELNKIIDNINPNHVGDMDKEDLDVWLICFNAFLQLRTKGANQNNHNNRARNWEYVDSWAMNSISRKRLSISQQLFNRLDDLYQKLKDLNIRDRRTSISIVERNFNDLFPYLREYQKLSCGLGETIIGNTGSKRDDEYFKKHERRLLRVWDSIEDIVEEIFDFLDLYLPDFDETMRKMIEDVQSKRAKKEKVRDCIRNWIDGMEYITSNQLSTKTATLKDSAEFRHILTVLNSQ